MRKKPYATASTITSYLDPSMTTHWNLLLKKKYFIQKDFWQLPISFIDTVKHSTLTFLYSARQFCRQKRNVYLHNTLRTLSNVDSINICRSDNGNGIQIFNISNYFDKLDKLILDKIKFREILVDNNKVHPTIPRENSIFKSLDKNCKHYFSASEISNILPSGSQPFKVHSLAKVHKDGTAVRYVVSM